MDLTRGDGGPCKLLFVSRSNLAIVVQQVAPDMILVPRAKFEQIATSMLEVVEQAAA